VQLGEEPGRRPCSNADYSVSKSALTRHWRTLRESGLIRQEAQGNKHRNWLRREELNRLPRTPGTRPRRINSRLKDVLAAELGSPDSMASPRPGAVDPTVGQDAMGSCSAQG
jgi:DNA-binding transcriptional ArsR family regulator